MADVVSLVFENVGARLELSPACGAVLSLRGADGAERVVPADEAFTLQLLDRAGVRYETVNANEAKDLVERYDVKQAPTLVLLGQDSFTKYRGVSDIKGWLMQRN